MKYFVTNLGLRSEAEMEALGEINRRLRAIVSDDGVHAMKIGSNLGIQSGDEFTFIGEVTDTDSPPMELSPEQFDGALHERMQEILFPSQ